MNGYIDPAKLNPSELALLENYTLKSYGNIGSLVSRSGITRYNTNQMASGGSGVGSGFEATINGTDYLIANIINGGSSALYYEDSPYTGVWTAITGANGTAQAHKLNYAFFRDKVYIANRSAGVSTNAVWDGTTAGFYDMGCIPPNPTGITFTQLAGAGALGAGLYRYLFTFLYDNTQESSAITYFDVSAGVTLAPVTTFSTTANDAIQIGSIPVGGNRVTARKIYRSKAGTTDYYYLTTIRDNTTTNYKDGLADSDLGDSIDANALLTPNKPPFSKHIIIHKERSALSYLTESLYDAIPTGDITLTEDAGGSLDLLGTYTYRFYKAWLLNDETVILSKPLDKVITLTGGNQSVIINYIGTDNWFQTIAWQRTDGGGSEFRWVTVNGQLGREKTGFPLDDGTADGGVSVVTTRHIFPDNIQTDYSGIIIISDASKPDIFSTVETQQDGTLIPASNTWNIGEPITGIRSEENRIIIFSNTNIYELDTSSQSRQFWRISKLVSGIGSDDGMQVQCGEGYVFIKTSSVTKNKFTVYEWNGRSEPVPCELSIRKYVSDLNTAGTLTVKDLRYDQLNEQVHLITQYIDDSLATRTIIFAYNLDIRDDMNLGRWEIWLNATNLNLAGAVQTKSFGLLYLGQDGYVHYVDPTTYRDTIAGSGANFTTKFRLKTFEGIDVNYIPRRFRLDATATGAITPVLKTSADGTLNSGDNMTALASGFNQILQLIFTDATANRKRTIYFQVEMTANQQCKVHGVYVELTDKRPR